MALNKKLQNEHTPLIYLQLEKSNLKYISEVSHPWESNPDRHSVVVATTRLDHLSVCPKKIYILEYLPKLVEPMWPISTRYEGGYTRILYSDSTVGTYSR
jgi:hypothetical protein